MKALAALLAAVAGSSAIAQVAIPPSGVPAPIRIKIRHADPYPWAVKAMLEGQPIISPEISTILMITGMGQQPAQNAAQGANALFSGGKWLVNPTDNSLWFYPDRPAR